ncbi:hypothetical protein Tco_0923055 [Tanacetum coccineum]|uniref:Uncharacterized protein n=1 Tax=Tanacetum coccineum TaxID=301880 RepID=A0ABQ5D008_9ASTR
MGKSSRNKRKQLENYKLTYSDIGPLMYTGTPLTQEEAEREALAISICERYSLLEEKRPVIETMAYSDKYKKILDRICLDKMKLDGMSKEEEEAIIKVKGEALIEKEDPKAFVIPIRLEAKTSLDTAESDSDNEEEYVIQRNKFRASIYDPLNRSLALQEVLNPFRKICVWKKVVSFLGYVALQHVEMWKPIKH